VFRITLKIYKAFIGKKNETKGKMVTVFLDQTVIGHF